MLGSIRRPEEEEVFGVQDWAEVHRLNRQGVPKRAIARRLGMSHTTVHRLLGLREPPRYERRRAASLVDPFTSQIAAMLDTDPKVPATVVLQHLRRDGYAGGITILKDHLAKVRPQFLAARTFQRTTYLPGEISQIDWWHTGAQVPVGKGATREAFALVATLPASAAHVAVFTFGRTTGDLLPAALGCFERLGGVPDKVICDNDTAIVRERRGGVAILHDEVVSFFGQLGATVVPVRPAIPRPRARSSEPTATWTARSCRCDASRTLRTCRPSTTTGRPPWPFGAIIDAWGRSFTTPGASSAGSCARCPILARTPPGMPRRGSPATASAASATSTTRSRRGFRDGGSASAARRSKS